MDEPEKLTPKEILLKSEGDAMLRSIAASQPKQSAILGPDGKPVDAQPAIDAQAAFVAAQKKRADELHARMKELMETDGNAAEVLGTILACHRLLFWAKAELYCKVGAEEDLIEFVDRFMKQAANKPFELKNVVRQLKHEVLPIVEKIFKRDSALHGARLLKLRRVSAHLDAHGFELPPKVKEKLQNFFRVGDLLIVHGDKDAVTHAMIKLAQMQTPKAGKTYFLSSTDETRSFAPPHVVVMPRAWHVDAASHITKLYSALEPMTNDEAALLIVEQLETLYLMGDKPVMQRKGQALVRLYQWARERAAALIVGDVVTEDVFDARLYGSYPHVLAKLVEVEGQITLMLDGELVP